MPDKGLGRIPPSDDRHLERYPLQLMRAVPTVERFLPLPYSYKPKYDQGSEGACVGYALSWAVSILNRRYYDAFGLYREAQRVDEWPGESYDGTSVRAGCDVLRKRGHRLMHRGHNHDWDAAHGIVENRWTRTVDGVRTAIAAGIPVVLGIDWLESFYTPVEVDGSWWLAEREGGRVAGGHAICCYAASDRRQAVKLVNSWGTSFPYTFMSYNTLEKLLNGVQYPGEAAIIVDRVGDLPLGQRLLNASAVKL